MAEAVFRDIVLKNGLQDNIFIDSCGTAGYHIGEPPHIGTRKILDNNGISWKGIKSSKLEKRHLKEFDFLIAMDTENLADINRLKSEGDKGIVKLLSDFAEGNWISVPDPWYTGDFELTYELVKNGCEMLLEHLCDNPA